MPAVWPATLPQFPVTGWEESAEPNTITTEVGSGPPKIRRRSTRERVFQSTYMEFKGTQKATFEAFWLVINQGVDAFEWSDMATEDPVEFRFVDGKKPKFKSLTPALDPDKRFYSATLELERL